MHVHITCEIYAYNSSYIYTSTYACVCMCVRMYMYLCLCVYNCGYLCSRVCVFLYECVYLSVRVCVVRNCKYEQLIACMNVHDCDGCLYAKSNVKLNCKYVQHERA